MTANVVDDIDPQAGDAPWRRYLGEIDGLLRALVTSQAQMIDAAARLVHTSLVDDGVLHIFGSGHSQMAAQEIYLRAGGLASVNAILDNNLSFYGTVNSDRLERLEGYAEVLLHDQDLRSDEVVIVVSNSGLNPVPIEVATIASKRGCKVVAVTSARQYQGQSSRHSSGARLADVADVVVDTGVPVGDAVIALDAVAAPVGAVSTVLATVVVQSIVIQAAALCADAGSTPPVFRSANLAGADDENAQILLRYKSRLPNMRL